jgi:hypothetical protein
MGRDRLGNFVNGDTVHGHTSEPFRDFELSGVVEGGRGHDF